MDFRVNIFFLLISFELLIRSVEIIFSVLVIFLDFDMNFSIYPSVLSILPSNLMSFSSDENCYFRL